MEPLIPGLCYPIYNNAHGNKNLFREPENYRYFLQQYQKHLSPVADTLAWCLMPNHFHLLIKIKVAKGLENHKNLEGLNEELLPSFISKQISNLFSSYSMAVNIRYNRKGSLFIKNFKRKQISSNEYFGQLIAYIHLNAIKHGFATLAEDWVWTYYHEYLSNKFSFINKYPALDWFGSIRLFKPFHEEYVKELRAR